MVVAPVGQPLSPRSTLETASSCASQTVLYTHGIMPGPSSPSSAREYQSHLIVTGQQPLRIQTGAQQLYRPHVASCITSSPGGVVVQAPLVLTPRNVPSPMRTMSQMEVLNSGSTTHRGVSATATPRTLSTAATSLTNANRSQQSGSIYQSGESSGAPSTPRVLCTSGGRAPNFLISSSQVEAQLQEEILSLHNLPPMEQDFALRRIRLLTDLKHHYDVLSQTGGHDSLFRFNPPNTSSGVYASHLSSPRTVQRLGMTAQGFNRLHTSGLTRNLSENNIVAQGHNVSAQTMDRYMSRMERIHRLQNELRIYYESLKHNGPVLTMQPPRSYHTSVPSSPRRYENSMANVHATAHVHANPSPSGSGSGSGSGCASARSSVSAVTSPREAFAFMEQAYASPRSIFVSESSQENFFDIGCGLSPTIIQELPISRYQSSVSEYSEEQRSCTICLEDFVSAEFVRRLPCTHAYHTRCIDEWLLRSTKCPICKWDCVSLLV